MTDNYTKTAIFLHWTIAICFIFMLGLGLVMGEDEILPRDLRYPAYQLHKSLGLLILLLSFMRLAWRLMHKAPALPSGMPTYEIWAAKAVHVGFYVLMFVLPLSGWALVSASPRGIPTMWFGLFEWPHLPFLAQMDMSLKKDVSHDISEVHESLAWISIAMIGLHVGAALKHYFIDRDNVVTHMIPCLKPLTKK